MPSLNHAIVQDNLCAQFRKDGKFRVLPELTLDIDGKSLTPDISLYSRSLRVDFKVDIIRMPEPPLLAVEIFSPRQGTQDVLDKLPIYFEHGVGSVWIVSPPLHHIEIHTADGAVLRFLDGIATDPLTGVTADLATVFA